jgi:hypothetical protein
MIPVGVGVHQGIVQKGDSILLFDGSIWQVQQPLVCTYDGQLMQSRYGLVVNMCVYTAACTQVVWWHWHFG